MRTMPSGPPPLGMYCHLRYLTIFSGSHSWPERSYHGEVCAPDALAMDVKVPSADIALGVQDGQAAVVVGRQQEVLDV